jgi:hypothetical protein
MTGKRGWHKRINNNKTQVKRTAEFSDGISIDKDGVGLDKMESAIKKATLKSIKPTIVAPNPSAVRCGSSDPLGSVPNLKHSVQMFDLLSVVTSFSFASLACYFVVDSLIPHTPYSNF